MSRVQYDAHPGHRSGRCLFANRKRDGNVAWEELVGLFELIDDPEGEGVAALNPDLKEVLLKCKK